MQSLPHTKACIESDTTDGADPLVGSGRLSDRSMIADLTLRWVVTVLFGLSFAECAYALAAGHRKWTGAVGHVLHLVMSVAMIVMAWPVGLAVPNRPSLVFFLLAAVWFVSNGSPTNTTPP
jgi:hypothetical protein